MECIQCGRVIEAIKNRQYHYTECGLPNVYIYGITQYDCPDCDEVFVKIPKIKLLHKSIAKAIIMKEESLSGAEIKFLRKELKEKAVDFAAAISITPETLSRFENDKKDAGASIDKLIRMTYLVGNGENYDRFLGKGLLKALKLLAIAPKPAEPKIFEFNPTDWMSNNVQENGCSVCSPA